MEPGGAEGQLAAPPVAPPPPPPAWEAVLHLVLPILASQFDRYSVRLVSREWRGAADHTWQAAALNCSPPGPGPPPPRLASGAFLLPRLRSLSLLEFNTQQQLEDVVGNQLHEVVGSGALPLLRSLELCTSPAWRAPAATPAWTACTFFRSCSACRWRASTSTTWNNSGGSTTGGSGGCALLRCGEP
mgnify:CR=1 FL=1